MTDYAGGFSARPYTLHLSVTEAGQSGNSSYFNWTLYVSSNSGFGSWTSNSYPWNVTVAGQGFSGSHNLDFRPDSTGKTITIASGSTGWVGHDGNGNLNIGVSASWANVSVFGTASCGGTFSAARIAIAPGQAGKPAASLLTPTACTLTWSAAPRGNANIDHYEYQVSTSSSFTSTALDVTLGVVLTDSTADNGTLVPGTTYYARVRAHSGDGYGPWSATSDAFTLPSGFYRWDGVAWRPTIVYAWNGTAQVQAEVLAWNGTTWKAAG